MKQIMWIPVRFQIWIWNRNGIGCTYEWSLVQAGWWRFLHPCLPWPLGSFLYHRPWYLSGLTRRIAAGCNGIVVVHLLSLRLIPVCCDWGDLTLGPCHVGCLSLSYSAITWDCWMSSSIAKGWEIIRMLVILNLYPWWIKQGCGCPIPVFGGYEGLDEEQ